MMQGRVQAKSSHHPRAVAAALPHGHFAGLRAEPRADVLPRPTETGPERLPWPVAASVILVTCAGLWLGVAGLARLVLG